MEPQLARSNTVFSLFLSSLKFVSLLVRNRFSLNVEQNGLLRRLLYGTIESFGLRIMTALGVIEVFDLLRSITAVVS